MDFTVTLVPFAPSSPSRPDFTFTMVNTAESSGFPLFVAVIVTEASSLLTAVTVTAPEDAPTLPVQPLNVPLNDHPVSTSVPYHTFAFVVG